MTIGDDAACGGPPALVEAPASDVQEPGRIYGGYDRVNPSCEWTLKKKKTSIERYSTKK
jgi:hypothetical protein